MFDKKELEEILDLSTMDGISTLDGVKIHCYRPIYEFITGVRNIQVTPKSELLDYINQISLEKEFYLCFENETIKFDSSLLDKIIQYLESYLDKNQNKKTIKEIYNLEYDKSEIKSSLIKWYNKLLDKAIDELDVIDISKMIRQDVLKELAIDKAIGFFYNNPYDGEMLNGDLLALLVMLDFSFLNKSELYKLVHFVISLDNNFEMFDWQDDISKEKFISNLKVLQNSLITILNDRKFSK